MTIALADKIVLVTGAAGGIGREICGALTRAGASVIAADLNDTAADVTCDEYHKLDVTVESDWQKLTEHIEAKYGRLDGLVNNAGVSLVCSVESTTREEWRRIQSINVESILVGTQVTLPLLKVAGAKNSTGASIVNLSSIGGLRGAAFNSAYCASKASVKNFSKSCAHEFSAMGYNIRVNSVHPGGVDTPMLNSIIQSYVDHGLAPSFDEASAGVKARHVLGRLADASEIAGGVVYLCSDAASFVTGSELVIDGGFTAI